MLNARKLMVLRSDRFGDVILTTGYVDTLRRSLPGAVIDLWLEPGTIACEEILSEGLNCRPLPFDRFLNCSDRILEEWLAALEAEQYDCLIVPQFTLGYPEILVLSRLSVSRRWGHRNWQLAVDPEWLYLRLGEDRRPPGEWITDGPEPEPGSMEVEKHAALAGAQGLSDKCCLPVLRGVAAPPPETRQGLLIWPGSGGADRRWPAPRFAEVAAALGYGGATVAATPSEWNWAVEQCEALEAAGLSAEKMEVDASRVRATAQWLAGFERVLVNDTGAAHLAAAAGASVVSIAGSHVGGRFTLTGERTLTVFSDAPCAGCHFHCLFDDEIYPCIAGIDAGAVAGLIQAGKHGRQVLPADWLPEAKYELFQRLHKANRSRERDWGMQLRGEHSACRNAERRSEEAELARRELQEELSAARDELGRLTAALQGLPGPRISVITPSYQQGHFIEETIRSVLAQDYPNFEHIVIDGGSTDETVSILKRYPHLQWVSEPDLGQTHAINKGILMSTGDIIAYLNADDVYRPGAFQHVAAFFTQHPEARIVTGDCDYIDEESRVTGQLKARYEGIEGLIRYWGWGRWHCIPQQSTFWRRDILAETGLFDTRYDMVMDYDMWLRAAERMAIHTMPVTLAAFRLAGETKTTSRTHEMYLEEFAASRRRWHLLPRRRRLAVKFEAHRHVAGRLLDMSEHYCLNDLNPGITVSLLRTSLGQWWPQAVSPRWWLTAIQVFTPPGRLRHLVRRAHRTYLGLKWAITNRIRGGPAA